MDCPQLASSALRVSRYLMRPLGQSRERRAGRLRWDSTKWGLWSLFKGSNGRGTGKRQDALFSLSSNNRKITQESVSLICAQLYAGAEVGASGRNW